MVHLALDLWSLLYWTLCPERLAASDRERLEQAEEVVVSSSICWQMHDLVESGSLKLAVPLEEFWRRLALVERVTIVCPEPRHWLAARRSPAALAELDRLVVAVARLQGCALLSPRREMLEAGMGSNIEKTSR